MQDSEILQILKAAEEDGKWFSEKYKELRTKYEGKVVAIKNKNVVGDAESVEELVDEVKKKGEDAAYILIETIPPKDVSFIL
jgi:alkanesulfonate monooxygenase SsuD/methylene tetrahydromethanopterin reductase-like flavin-dependent oxidoreductase (luciferase family)